ncbi:hypothetical protein EVAR_15963_1 [Eumeta japonica]|uniref:Uncharacterized protein n=1 Tax=Eumeta variegata TaxID=151549 RepID=A0A4C1ULZ1_EUMVA|nr:hypothetical protein EVAR_15963_1 [Eumeta japonica]
MSEDEWMERKNEIGRSYFSNLQSNCEVEESVPERSSPLWLDVSAASLSSRKTYTPLPDLLFRAENPHDDTESFYQRLGERTLKYMHTNSDTSSADDTYAEKSSTPSITEEHNQVSGLEKDRLSISTTLETTRRSKRRGRKSGDIGHRKESKKSKVDAGVQTESISYDEIIFTSLKSDLRIKKESEE